MAYILLLITISTILSYLILKCIYTIIFKPQKHISKFLVVLGSIGLIMFYYTPYSFYLEPSYWEFRNMCKLNELPNNEEKYNKILGYFDTSLDTLDWEELIESEWEVSNKANFYKKGIFEYAATTKRKRINRRIYAIATFYSNESKINRYNTNAMIVDLAWHSRRYFLEEESMSSLKLQWIEGDLSCYKITKYNLEAKK
ncbi:hypothetical protein [Helicobacter sp.]|uniref:hypothetical protein n=1 Tax=Helicobacter sp. TaxID=218 RepID=UPI003752A1B9|nr:hypothetical protein [Helicobacter sp.]MDD7346137.1 hypothetical protein [Helicobacter sp.]